MAKTQKVTFSRPVYKDQTVAANYGVLIAVGDTVVVKADGDGTDDGAVSLVLTHVENGGRTIGWNQLLNTASNYETTDITRVHKKHQFACPGLHDYINATDPAGPINGFTINGIYHAITPIAATSQVTANALADAINAVLLGNGNAVVTWNNLATDTFTIKIFGTTYLPNTIDNNGVDVAMNVV